MIVTPAGEGFLVVTQNDHAALAAELLSLWRTDGLPEHPRRRALLRATREHDNGWLEADSAPRRREDGRLHDFMSIDGEWRREIWQRGVKRHAEGRPWEALLILEHALNLHRRHREDPDWRGVFDSWSALREEWLEDHEEGEDEDALRADYRFLDAADTLSLALCAGWREPGEHAGFGYRARLGEDGGHLEIDPFPLAGTTTFRLACRRLEDRTFPSDTELAMALAAARWQRLPIRVSPPSGPA